ncbi:MAG: UDP-glucose 4-epimerase GalE [Erysipelotrichaceae bacterium]|nr:UDP-glucose 4-epimerase GalE [Erysipelotrichaceae bacterium]MDD6093339.1 UDP-glucose 4-epimerase GalE [bacterium]MDY3934824.1 UDP-glucose 4-epimerase GalE [Bacilli bacterium]
MRVLVTGGTGYIGSHTIVELIGHGYDVVAVDDFSNSKPIVLDKIKEITGKKIKFYELDVCDKEKLRVVFMENEIDAVIHFAGFKAVGESVAKPLKYYRNNLDSTITLLEVMNEFGVKKIVFSSSATVYGDPEELPIKETAKLGVTNPYGATKLFIENILKDVYISDNDYSIAILRYFNPIGAHESGLLGEDPSDIPNNLMPYIVKVATGELPHLNIFGNDYDTKDGTGVRDYIHVVDLAIGHISALEYIDKNKGIDYYNLGTGHGYSVMEIVSAFSEVNHVDVPYEIAPRRDGDIAECYADTTYAKEKLHWEATHDLTDMVESAYNFVVKNNE